SAGRARAGHRVARRLSAAAVRAGLRRAGEHRAAASDAHRHDRSRTVNAADFAAISPLLILAAAPVVLILLAAVRRTPAVAAWISALALAFAFAAVVLGSAPLAARAVTPLVIVD